MIFQTLNELVISIYINSALVIVGSWIPLVKFFRGFTLDLYEALCNGFGFLIVFFPLFHVHSFEVFGISTM